MGILVEMEEPASAKKIRLQVYPPVQSRRWEATTGQQGRSARPAVVWSVTREEIDLFWRLRRMDEEEHRLAAEKAVARIRARALTVGDYERFVDSLQDSASACYALAVADLRNHELSFAVGIKDWWTRSKYAYLNQPIQPEVDS